MIKYVIGHWTAGNYKPCNLDLNSYQMLIDGDGIVHTGKPVGQASSTGGMNSITYNISCCGGLNSTPIKAKQIESFFKNCAIILKKYNLSVDKFYTHAEIGQMVKDKTITKLLPNNSYLKQNIGKVDLMKLPYNLNGMTHGDFIRHKIKYYYLKLN